MTSGSAWIGKAASSSAIWTDHEVAAEFAAIEGAVVFHGAHNKHELTFARLAP
jgi:hypothetical protein